MQCGTVPRIRTLAASTAWGFGGDAGASPCARCHLDVVCLLVHRTALPYMRRHSMPKWRSAPHPTTLRTACQAPLCKLEMRLTRYLANCCWRARASGPRCFQLANVTKFFHLQSLCAKFFVSALPPAASGWQRLSPSPISPSPQSLLKRSYSQPHRASSASKETLCGV